MADTTPQPSPSSEPPSAPPSSASEQARIRKERREAKIKAGGSARLNRISGLGGGLQRDPPPPASAPTSHADPDEIDISQHFYEPQTTRRTPLNTRTPPSGPAMNDDQLRQMMLGFDPSSTPPTGANPFAGFPGMPPSGASGGPDGEDPMVKMLQQIMGSMGGEGAGEIPPFPGMPPLQMPGPGQEPPPTVESYAYVWRILHAIFALGLGIYIAFTTTFTGTKFEREKSGLAFSAEDQDSLSPSSIHFFYIFATAEMVLQTSRFFMEKGKVQQTGILGTIIGFLPEPYKGYLGLGSRYLRIWSTVSGDAMVCVFVLGVCAWLRGA